MKKTSLLFFAIVFFSFQFATSTSQKVITITNSPEFVVGYFVLPTSLKIYGGDETWDENITYADEIRVCSGNTLTITGDVGFEKDGKVIVEPGGTLILDGGTITSAGEYTWAGIEVWGDPNSSSIYDQGVLIIKNNATIENAEVAIRNYDPIPEEHHQGGIIKCYGSTFKNNIKAVDMRNYPHNNQNYFDDCGFVYDEFYLGSGTPGYFMEFRNMEGINITGCDFTNSTTEDYVGRGIYSYSSQVTVIGKCTSGTQPCTEWKFNTFTNLAYGIYAIASGSSKFINVEQSDFTDNFRGIYIGGMSNARVVSNNFEINTPYETDGGYGLYLDHSTAYEVEENNFFHDWHGTVGVGLIVNESGGDPNRIYRNYFYKLECGMDIQGENKDKSGIGLELKCNQYEVTFMDKIITWDEPFVNAYSGIASSQGSSGSNPEDMAGNLFYVLSQTPNDDYDDILNEGNSIVYYYPSTPNDQDVRPVDFTNETVDLEEVPDVVWNFENGCPPTDDGGGIGIGDTKSKMAESELKIDSTENLLTMLIDGGNTEATQTDVDNSIPPETMQVYNELMAKSPYLSDTVVSTAIEKEDVLPGAMIRDIMVANPNTAKSEKLMQKLDDRWDPLPEYMKAQIMAGRSIVSIREETESRLATFKLEKAKNFNALVRYYTNDTIDPIASNDSLMVLYNNNNSISAKYGMALLSGEQGDWSMGHAVLNDIPVQFELSAREATGHSQMLYYYNLLSELAQEEKSIYDADEAQITTMLDIESANTGSASTYSRNILLALGEIAYEEPIILPDLLKSSAAEDEYTELLSKATEAPGFITIQPNPAKDYVILVYDLQKAGEAAFEIHNINAKLKFTKNLLNKQDQLTIDTRDWKTGVYIASLKIKGKLVESVKFTIID